MKRVRCPKCDNYITFDETKYSNGQSLVFQCPECNKQFRIKIGLSKLKERQKDMKIDENAHQQAYGAIVVIENVFHYKQVLPLQFGVNRIGHYVKGNDIECPIETTDPSVDLTHCNITVSKDKHGKLKYELSDGPSYTGTYVDNQLLGDRERRIIQDGSLFTVGATSIILRTSNQDDE